MCCSDRFFINCFKVTCLMEIILSIICLAKQIQTANYEDELFVDGITEYKQKGQMIYLSFFLICLSFGVIGFIYSYKKIKWIYPIAIIFNLVLVGYFSALISAKDITQQNISKHVGEYSSDCLNIPFFSSSQEIYTLSKEFWCQNDCPCSINDPTKWEPFFWKNYSYNTGVPTDTFQECQYFESKFKAETGKQDDQFVKQTNFLIALENRFQCSSLCSASKIYTFYHVSSGMPDQENTCHEYLIEFINSFIGSFRLIGVVGLSLNLVQLFLLISHFISSKKKQNKIISDNSKAVSLPKSNHDESYIQKKGQKQKDAL